MALILNAFKANLNPVTYELPSVDFASWEESTQARNCYASSLTWRYTFKDNGDPPADRIRMVFIEGPTPEQFATLTFDVGIQWKLGAILIERALELHFQQQGFRVEKTRFQTFALRPITDRISNAIELATGISFSVKRPFREEQYDFAINFDWEVRAQFRASLADKALARMAVGMPVIYQPKAKPSPKLAPYENRFLGKVRGISEKYAIVTCRADSSTAEILLSDLRLEATPAVIKNYDQTSRSRKGPSTLIRKIQQLKHTYTSDNRRNPNAFRDRLDEILAILGATGTSANQLVLPLSESRPGSVSIAIQPSEASFGGLW